MTQKKVKAKKLSISVFFPCYNDAGTIASMIELSTAVLKKITSNFEIIVVDDGSSDASREILKELSTKNPKLKLIFHKVNQGYGGALISGFRNSTKDVIFYTDGDFQFDVREIELAVNKCTKDLDIVQGYKLKRHDPWYRVIIGNLYNFTVKFFFAIKIKDVDCAFKLIRKRVIDKIQLNHKSGVITVELVKKIQDANYKFAEVPVSHYWRSYGKSQFFNFKRIFRVLIELIQLWNELVLSKWLLIYFPKKKS